MLNSASCINYYKVTYIISEKSIEYFSHGAGYSSVRFIVQGHWPRVIECMELFQAPRESVPVY